MSQWIRKCPIQPIHLAIVLLAAYYMVYRFSFLTSAVFLFLFGRLLQQYGWKKVRKALPIFLGIMILFWSHQLKSQLDEKHSPDTIKTIQIVPDSVRVNGDRLSFQGKLEGHHYQVFYRLKSQKEQVFFRELDQLIDLDIDAELEIPDNARNFNGFDYQVYLKTRGIYRIVNVKTIKAIHLASSWNPMDWLSILRRKALLHIRHHFPEPMRHYMTGLLFGELDTDFEQMKDIYSSLGIIHLFALSGMQVGFFIDQLRYLLLRLGWTKETVFRLQLPFSILYAGMTGWSVSVIRALVQKILGNVGLRGFDNMAVTLAICYCIMPHFLLSAGGVLSFGYAFLLSVFDFESCHPWKRIVMESTAISIGILPLLMFYFYSFQPLSILLTLVFSFIFDVILLPSLSLLFLVSPFLVIPQINGVFVWGESMIHWVSDHSPPPMIFGKPNSLQLLLLLIVLACIYDFFYQKKMRILLICSLLCLLFVIKYPMTNEVTMVDIGQGDSLFIRDIKGHTMLIDVGGQATFNGKEEWQHRQIDANADKTLIPYLKSRGIHKIDQLVLTHTDTDHVGDMEVVAQQFRIGEILVSPGSLTVPDFVERLKKMGVQVRVLQAGDCLPIMGSQLQVLYPIETGDGENNDSIVLYGKLLDKTFLFTGDLEGEGEATLVSQYPTLPVDILKAGHHGSKGSSTEVFLDHVRPELALLSAGKNNQYKHPHQETLDRLKERGINSFRTDMDGAVRFTGWNSWKVETVK